MSKRRSVTWYLENGCIVGGDDPTTYMARQMIIGVYSESQGRPCIECNCKSTCPAWKIILQEKKNKTLPSIVSSGRETNKQIAARLGITPRQVSKRRAAGELL